MLELQHSHNYAYCGLDFEGKSHVRHEGLSTNLVFESSKQRWRMEDYGWPIGPWLR